MKVLPTIAGLLLAGTFATTAHDGPSTSYVMTQCKAEINDTFEDVSRIRTSRLRTKSSGTYITFRVSTEGADAQKITCSYQNGVVSLADSKGDLIASKTSVASNDS